MLAQLRVKLNVMVSVLFRLLVVISRFLVFGVALLLLPVLIALLFALSLPWILKVILLLVVIPHLLITPIRQKALTTP
ncbi:hypothetical protein CJF47_11790 [Aeromonas sobria]|nr:hypothetical protein CJF47_11790 [Aeromonas sobria]